MATHSSHWGDFVDSGYRKTPDGDGVEIDLTFTPGTEVDATKIGFTQSLTNIKQGVPAIIDPTERLRIVQGGPNAGNKLDRRMDRTNPMYGSDNLAVCKLEDTKENNAPTATVPDKTTATYKLGHRFSDGGTAKVEDAWMHDEAGSDRSKDSGMEFETTALAIDGTQKGTYYGSVKWGFQVDAKGKLTRIAPALVSAGVPSQHFLAAAAGWNAATARGTVVVSADNTQFFDELMTAMFKLAKDTKVKIKNIGAVNGVAYSKVTLDNGAHAGKTGYIKATDLTDKGDGQPTTDLPVPEVQVLNQAHELNQDVPGPWREFRTLAKGTRVSKTGDRPGQPSTTQIWIKVVDGPDTGVEGYVESGKLTRERA
jgi:hypothetical protein